MDIFALPFLIVDTGQIVSDSVTAFYDDADFRGEFISNYSLVKDELDTQDLIAYDSMGTIWNGEFHPLS